MSSNGGRGTDTAEGGADNGSNSNTNNNGNTIMPMTPFHHPFGSPQMQPYPGGGGGGPGMYHSPPPHMMGMYYPSPAANAAAAAAAACSTPGSMGGYGHQNGLQPKRVTITLDWMSSNTAGSDTSSSVVQLRQLVRDDQETVQDFLYRLFTSHYIQERYIERLIETSFKNNNEKNSKSQSSSTSPAYLSLGPDQHVKIVDGRRVMMGEDDGDNEDDKNKKKRKRSTANDDEFDDDRSLLLGMMTNDGHVQLDHSESLYWLLDDAVNIEVKISCLGVGSWGGHARGSTSSTYKTKKKIKAEDPSPQESTKGETAAATSEASTGGTAGTSPSSAAGATASATGSTSTTKQKDKRKHKDSQSSLPKKTEDKVAEKTSTKKAAVTSTKKKPAPPAPASPPPKKKPAPPPGPPPKKKPAPPPGPPPKKKSSEPSEDTKSPSKKKDTAVTEKKKSKTKKKTESSDSNDSDSDDEQIVRNQIDHDRKEDDGDDDDNDSANEPEVKIDHNNEDDIGNDAPPAVKQSTKRRKKDPNKPKKVTTTYMIWSNENRSRIKEENPDASFGEIGKILGVEYKNISGEEMAELKQKVAKDKERYEREMAEYEQERPDDEEDEDEKTKTKKPRRKNHEALETRPREYADFNDTDVLIGGKKQARDHSGNIKYKELYLSKREEYHEADAGGKDRIMDEFRNKFNFWRLGKEDDEGWSSLSPSDVTKRVYSDLRMARHASKASEGADDPPKSEKKKKKKKAKVKAEV